MNIETKSWISSSASLCLASKVSVATLREEKLQYKTYNVLDLSLELTLKSCPWSRSQSSFRVARGSFSFAILVRIAERGKS